MLHALLKRPAYPTVVIVTLALGLGATIGIFSVTNAVLLRELPYPGADRIVVLNTIAQDGSPTGRVAPANGRVPERRSLIIMSAEMPRESVTRPTAAELLARFDDQARARIADEPGIRVERRAATVRISGLWDCVMYSQLTQATADAAIALEKARALPPGRKLEWKLYGHDRPGDLGERLRKAGFEAESRETLVVLDLTDERTDTRAPEGVTIRRVGDRAGLADAAAVGIRAFGQDYSAMNDEFLARIAHGTVLFYVAYDAAEPVCAARLELPRSGAFAGLYGGGTVPEHRGRGIYRALVDVRARAARERGYRYLTVDAADTSLPILRRLGFVPLTTVTAWTWQAD
jgi:GNAT superfamily N-acetyltransferase